MLAENGEYSSQAGALNADVQFTGEWLSSLLEFIATALPAWRDDPVREAVHGETRLTAQLCARLNSLTRHAPGWDILQFRREEPDDTDARRAVDLVAAPRGQIIWLAGREYNEYQTLLPIECKRLPTPPGADRDEREYLISQYTSTGGVQRFKAGNHGAAHSRAAMIGFIQNLNVEHWVQQIDAWVDAIVAEPTIGWSSDDKLALIRNQVSDRVAALQSNHTRQSGLHPIRIDHLWIEM
ncbi:MULTISPECIES: hypothetical protein [Agrobacterium]|uniref:hypothetical protein n=1 Tax=Agrobacterium tumefaciens TaxID=358 RepID=UPI000EF1C12D|nr:hypothetical protein At1D1108_50420 [Agrobacterium tumefaciens]NSY09790.1 hypothetical protein [Agrobacterium tumefaciens]NSY93353.1 hypothetical protein [Agrobacterium tumefaciens]